MSPEILDQIATIMREQIANPSKAGTSSESAFVSDKIRKQIDPKIGWDYWNWICSYDKWSKPRYNAEIMELQRQLDAIDRLTELPDWATFGT